MPHLPVNSLRSAKTFNAEKALKIYRNRCWLSVRIDFLGLAFIVAAGSQTSLTFLAFGKGSNFFWWAIKLSADTAAHTPFSDAVLPIFIEEIIGLFLLSLAVSQRVSIRILSFRYFSYLHQPIPSYEEHAPADIASSWGTLRNPIARIAYRTVKIIVILFSYSAIFTGSLFNMS